MNTAQQIATTQNPKFIAMRDCSASAPAPHGSTYVFSDGSVLKFDKSGGCIASDDESDPHHAKFVGMVDVDGEQFAHFTNVSL